MAPQTTLNYSTVSSTLSFIANPANFFGILLQLLVASFALYLLIKILAPLFAFWEALWSLTTGAYSIGDYILNGASETMINTTNPVLDTVKKTVGNVRDFRDQIGI